MPIVSIFSTFYVYMYVYTHIKYYELMLSFGLFSEPFESEFSWTGSCAFPKDKVLWSLLGNCWMLLMVKFNIFTSGWILSKGVGPGAHDTQMLVIADLNSDDQSNPLLDFFML